MSAEDHPVRTTVRVIVGLFVAGMVIWGAIWGIGVVVSGPKGQGDAYREKNSAENWTAAQARFEDEYADIVATDRKITLSKPTKDSDRTAQDTYKGLQSYCISAVGEYNADARKYLSRDFKAADLPQQIDNSDPSTDCEP